jgi:hypothetical protein
MATQGGCPQEIRGLVRILSSACQIVNERLMKCVQPAQETMQSSCLSRTFLLFKMLSLTLGEQELWIKY